MIEYLICQKSIVATLLCPRFSLQFVFAESASFAVTLVFSSGSTQQDNSFDRGLPSSGTCLYEHIEWPSSFFFLSCHH